MGEFQPEILLFFPRELTKRGLQYDGPNKEEETAAFAAAKMHLLHCSFLQAYCLVPLN